MKDWGACRELLKYPVLSRGLQSAYSAHRAACAAHVLIVCLLKQHMNPNSGIGTMFQLFIRPSVQVFVHALVCTIINFVANL